MMSERRCWQFRCRRAMHECNRAERGLTNERTIELEFDNRVWAVAAGVAYASRAASEHLHDWHRVGHRELAKQIVRMLFIHDRRIVICLAGLEELGESAMRSGQRLSGEHLPQQQ